MRPPLLTSHERRRAVWFGLLGAGVAYEFHELRDHESGYPLTWLFRWAFRVEHPAGRLVFVGSCGLFFQWFVRHILADVLGDVAQAVTEVVDEVTSGPDATRGDLSL